MSRDIVAFLGVSDIPAGDGGASSPVQGRGPAKGLGPYLPVNSVIRADSTSSGPARERLSLEWALTYEAPETA